jgi:TrpR-related protein YerC/YecD
MKDTVEKDQLLDRLCSAFLSLKNESELKAFLKDLCTPQELQALADRWNVCCLLAIGVYSYRDIQDMTGVSLATIGRVARFLNDEPHHGYQCALARMNKKK